MTLKDMSFPLNVPNRTSQDGLDFSVQSPEFWAWFPLDRNGIVESYDSSMF